MIDYQVARFVREHNLMRAMGWTREELMSHSPGEIEMHYSILDYEAQKAKEAEREAQHESQRRRH